jgi:hypothetical protein
MTLALVAMAVAVLALVLNVVGLLLSPYRRRP